MLLSSTFTQDDKKIKAAMTNVYFINVFIKLLLKYKDYGLLINFY